MQPLAELYQGMPDERNKYMKASQMTLRTKKIKLH